MDRAWRQLGSGDIPDGDADWKSVGLPFALSFNGYHHAGGSRELGQLYDRIYTSTPRGILPGEASAEDLRACLFKLARDDYFSGGDVPPNEVEPAFYAALLHELRRRKLAEESPTRGAAGGTPVGGAPDSAVAE